MANEDVFPIDVLKLVTDAMKVPVVGSTSKYYKINYNPGMNTQIINALKSLDGTSLDALKYPLVAATMPLSEKLGSGFLEVTFPKIAIAYLTKTGTNSEFVLDKYSSDGVLKTILRPCRNELIKQLAFSTYTSMGDPDSYEYTTREMLSQQPIADTLSDFVDIIEILNLKTIFFPQIKTC